MSTTWALGCCEECGSVWGCYDFGQRPGAARGVWPTVGLGMLEAASPWGCRGELVPRGSSETDSVPPGSLRSDRRWTTNFAQTRTLPNRLKSPSCFSRTPRQGPWSRPTTIYGARKHLRLIDCVAAGDPLAVLERPSAAVKRCLAARRSRHTTHSCACWRSAAGARQHLRLPIGERHV